MDESSPKPLAVAVLPSTQCLQNYGLWTGTISFTLISRPGLKKKNVPSSLGTSICFNKFCIAILKNPFLSSLGINI